MEKIPGLIRNTNDSCLVLTKTLAHRLPLRQQAPWAFGDRGLGLTVRLGAGGDPVTSPTPVRGAVQEARGL